MSDPVHRKYRQRGLLDDEVGAEIVIEAPIEAVWSRMSAIERYPEWNPFTKQVKGRLEVGAWVDLDVHMPGTKQRWTREQVNLVEPGRRFCWGMIMGHPVFLVTNRVQELSALGEGRTSYRTVDRFSGLLTPLVMALYREPMRLGFEANARALKEACEREQ